MRIYPVHSFNQSVNNTAELGNVVYRFRASWVGKSRGFCLFIIHRYNKILTQINRRRFGIQVIIHY